MKRILWIEDDAVRLEGLMDPLREEGFEVNTATDYPQFVERLKEGKYDLFVVDLILPQASVGEQVAYEDFIDLVGLKIIDSLNKSHPEAPVIVVTVVKDTEAVEQYANVKRVLHKGNLYPSDFQEVVHSIIGGKVEAGDNR